MLGLLAPVLSLLGIEVTAITANVRRQAIVWGLIGALGLVCLTFLLVAANTGLTYVVGPVVAPLLIALVAAVIALIVFLVAHIRAGIEARKELERERSAETTALVTTAIVSALPVLLRSPLMREIGLPIVAAVTSALLLRKAGPTSDRAEP